MGRILINCLVVVSLFLGFAPLSVVVLQELSERSTDPETPTEREETAARSSGLRLAYKRSGKYGSADLPGRMIVVAASHSVSSQTPPLAVYTISPPHLHPLSGVLRI